MKTSARNRRTLNSPQNHFVTIASRLNFDEPFEDVQENVSVEEPKGYPDFFEDSDAINRYLW